jgi:lysophospholipase L1-like esterase
MMRIEKHATYALLSVALAFPGFLPGGVAQDRANDQAKPASAIAAPVRTAGPIIAPDSRVAVVGDSITEQKIYSRFIELYLLACAKPFNARVMQFGWSGERAGGFAARLDNDVLAFKPTLVTTCYGMNDGAYRPYTSDIGRAYEDSQRDIVRRLKAAGAMVLLGSPGPVDTKHFLRFGADSAKIYNDNLAQLRDIARRVADEEGAVFVNVFDTLYDVMSKAKGALGDDYDVCGRDGIHPGPNGHLVMAYAFLKAMGFDGDLGTIVIDLKGKPSAENGHTIVAAEGRRVEIESTRYPFCVLGNDAASNNARGILPYLPFHQDLNRLTLIVKRAKGERVRVSWDGVDKLFTREELEKGINLAAEFAENPFTEAFTSLDAAVAAKQNYETFMIKSQINSQLHAKQQFGGDPDVLAAIDILNKKLWEKEDCLDSAAHGSVAPIRHTITIEDDVK